jgi:hypothetical protein
MAALGGSARASRAAQTNVGVGSIALSIINTQAAEAIKPLP